MATLNDKTRLDEMLKEVARLEKLEEGLQKLIDKCNKENKSKKFGDSAAQFRKKDYVGQIKTVRKNLLEWRMAKRFKENSC